MATGGLLGRAAVFLLIGASIAGCDNAATPVDQVPAPASTSPAPTPTPTTTPIAETGVSRQSPAAPTASSFGFPAEIDPGKRYLIYLHGKIIEDQGLPAISPEFGEYRYGEILDVLQSYGFVVVSEQRPKDADATEYARRVARQINELLNSGVPAGSITVVGASKGAAIAAIVSNLMGNSEVNYVLLGACHPDMVDEWSQQGASLSGNVLAIYDSADEYAGSCAELFTLSEGKGLGRHAEVILQVGTGHGILYEPLAEWVLPTVQWANQEQ
jgi:hypothetical protein